MKNINLLVLSIFILSINVYAKTIHKVLSLDEVYETTFGNGNYPKDSLEFWEGNNSVKVIIIDNNGREISTINSYKKNTKILYFYFTFQDQNSPKIFFSICILVFFFLSFLSHSFFVSFPLQ